MNTWIHTKVKEASSQWPLKIHSHLKKCLSFGSLYLPVTHGSGAKVKTETA